MASETILPQTYEVLPDVTLTVCPTDRFKVGMLSLSLELSLDRDISPVRSLLLSVLRRGCKSYPTLSDINRRLDELYATPYRVIDKLRGDCQYLGFGAELLENRYLLDDTDLCGEVLSLMQDMLFNPVLDDQGCLRAHYVESEKKNTIDRIRSLQNHPSAYAMARFLTAFYQDEPFFISLIDGAVARIGAITAEQLTEVWRDMLCHAPIRCFYVGGIPAQELIERLRSLLTPVLVSVGRAVQSPAHTCRLPKQISELHRIEEQGQEGQSHLLLGFRSGVTLLSPDYYAMMLCHELLGCSPISRLFVHVREAHSLCYSCSSNYRMERGDIIVSCGISAENRERAEQAILAQIEALQTGEFTETEWVAAKKSLIGGCRQLNDSTRGLSNFYELRSLLGIDQTVDDYIAHFEALTREDVIAAAQKLKLVMVYFRRGTGGGECDGEEDVADD